MEIHELVIEMKLLERRLTLYEEKYGVLSEDFYEALTAGKLERYDEYDESRADFSRWKGIYETWMRRKQACGEGVDIAPGPAEILALAAASLVDVPASNLRLLTRKLKKPQG
jgi:hypothetical protein